MKTKSYLFIVTLAFIGVNAFAQRGAQIGYVDMEYVLSNVSSYQEATKQLDTKVQHWKEEIIEKQNEINAMQRALENERPLLTNELIEERQEEIKYKEDKLLTYKQKHFGPEGSLFTLKRRLVKPVQDRVFNAIQEIGKTRKYDFIFENSSEALMLYSANRHDLSDEVLQMIDRSVRVDERDQQQKDSEGIADKQYKSVKQANKEQEDRAERQAKLNARKREQDAQRAAMQKRRDSIQAVRNAKLEKRNEAIKRRREQIQQRRDSIRNAQQKTVEPATDDI